MPEAVAVTLVIPRAKWWSIAESARKHSIALTLECSLRAVDDGVPLWHNVYSRRR